MTAVAAAAVSGCMRAVAMPRASSPTSPWLIVPLRSLADGKRRLAEALSPAVREALNHRFLVHMLQQARDWPGLGQTLIVSPCEQVLAHAREAGACTLRQPPAGARAVETNQALNAALEQARQVLAGWQQRPLLVASCDLPLLRSAELERLAQLGCQQRVVVASDRAGRGTNAVYLPAGADMRFCFGANSARRHVAAAARSGWPATTVRVPGLAFDIDTPADYTAWREARESAPV